MLDTRPSPIVQNDRGRRKIAPLADEASHGRGWLAPCDDVVVDTHVTIVGTYRAGSLGVDPGGRVALAWYWPEDWGEPQVTDPAAPNYVSSSTSSGVGLRVGYDAREGPPPWRRLLVVELLGRLAPGDELTITAGDRSGGSPGWLSQTFVQRAHRFRFLVDPTGAGQWRRLPDPPPHRVVAGEARAMFAVAPSDAVVGEPFEVLVRVEDRWRNPATGYRGLVELHAVEGVAGSEVTPYRFGETDGGVHRFEVVLSQPGVCRLEARDAEHGLSAVTNPIVCHAQAPELRLFWGDLHHQGVEGAGCSTVEESFAYARDVGGVSFTTYQANDVYVTDEAWREIMRVSREYNEPGRFVTLLGTEWTGTPEVGGDRNVFFQEEERPLNRSSHWGMEDLADEHTDLCPIPRFYEVYRGTNTMIHLHVGGDPSNLEFNDPVLERALEIHSAHATSEWFLEDALRRGYRMAVTANSDDIMGRPGASGPGRLTNRFVRGGLTGVWMPALTREDLWGTLYERRCYGTTGARIILWVDADGHPMGSELESDRPPRLLVRAWGTAGIERVDLFRGLTPVFSTSLTDYSEIKEGTLRVVWKGSKHKGTGRIQALTWDGSLSTDEARILAAREIAFDSPAEGIVGQDDRSVRWRSITAGDEDGIEIDYDGPDTATFRFESPVCAFSFQPREVRWAPKVVDAGTVGKAVIVSAVPTREPSRRVELTFVDDGFQPGINPYWVRVTQTDFEKAWSSPIYLTRR